MSIFNLDDGNHLSFRGDLQSPLEDLVAISLIGANYKVEKHVGVIASERWVGQGDKIHSHFPVAVLNYELTTIDKDRVELVAECTYNELLPFFKWVLSTLKTDYPGMTERVNRAVAEQSGQTIQATTTMDSGIPPNLNKQLRTVLLDCGPFATDQELKAIFVDERLSQWRNRIPQANNPTERVERAIEFLFTQHNNVGENALVLFVHALRDRHDKADACHQRLTDVASELEHLIKSRNL